MRVVLGAINIKREEPDTQTLDVTKAIIHEKYRGTSEAEYNDIALLRLQGVDGHCAKETDFVRTACMPDRLLPDGTECTISGWGATEKAHYSRLLRHAKVVLISQQCCMEENVYGNMLDDSMICAGNKQGGVDSCHVHLWVVQAGDSGGPLTCEENGMHYAYGIVSWGGGDSCGKQNKPGIYARITHFLDWVNSAMSSS